jgi:ketosteroid isomerase-like protein
MIRCLGFPLRSFVAKCVLAALALTPVIPRGAAAETPHGILAAAPSDSADVVAVVTRFHSALVAGDSAAALALLSPDMLILESGAVETRVEYRAHHLPADIDFARALPSTRVTVRIQVLGDAAWVVSTSLTQGQANGRQVNSAGAELVVLSRTATGWQIRAIHWSSRNRRS